jgi:transmembrane sensor
MKRSDHEDLFKKYQSGKVTPEEQAIVEDYILNHEFNPLYLSETELEKIMVKLGDRIRKVPFAEQAAAEAAPEVPAVLPVYRRWKSIVAVAAAVAAITLGTWLYYTSSMNGSSSRGIEGSLAYATDIAPGKNTATLTLADGKAINLSDAKSGVIIEALKLTYSDGTAITSSLREGTRETSSGQAVKQSHQDSQDEIASIPRNDGRVQTLVMSTPRGGTYQVVLPDGTKVWLNADSKISFPSQFIGSQRKIVLSGEAYFEVSHNALKPFVVQTDKQQVTVLGTHFNINSYADEGATKTTLLEGSVSVSYVPRLRSTSSRGTEGTLGRTTSRDPSMLRDDEKMPESIILKPNQQSVITGSNRITVKQIDPELAVAWKNGEFSFKKENLKDIMRSVARWYNVEVVYANDFQSQPFTGTVSKFDNISSVLKVLELTGKVHFKIEGRRVTVMK